MQKAGLKWKDCLQLLRVKHYIKNFLIFLPLFFGREIFVFSLFRRAFTGFLAFSFASSAIYILNDIQDCDKDRFHPVKRNRPIASGKISLRWAGALALGMIILSASVLILNGLSLQSALCLGAYLLLNLLYSFGLKNVALVDIAILTSGFVIRVLFGSLVTEIPISEWMYLTILMASLYAAIGKRRNELRNAGDGVTRTVLKRYNYAFLDKCMYLALTSAVVFYSLWAILEFKGTRMAFSIPFVLAISLLYSLIVEGDSYGDPVDVILHNPYLIILAILWGSIVFTVLYTQ